MTSSPSPWPCRLFGLDRTQLSPLEVTCLRVGALLTLLVAFLTFIDVRCDCGADLRNRVVGARVMLAGHDPYTFLWQHGMPEQWLDPVHEAKVHRLTVPPPTLCLYAAIAPLPYATQKLISWTCEWLALLASVALLVRAIPLHRQRVFFLLGAVLFLVVSDVWRLHVERGQVYVLHLLALSLAVHFCRKRQLDSVAGGLALGILALLRPNMLLFAPAFLVLRRWRTATSLIGTFAVGVLVTLPFMPASTWPSYLAMGEQYYRSIWAGDTMPDIAWAEHPTVAEGFDFSRSLTNVESSSVAVLYESVRQRAGLPHLDLGRLSKALMLLLGATLLVVLWFRANRLRQLPGYDETRLLTQPVRPPWGEALALMVVLTLDTEFCLPHRWGYVDVMLLAPLALMLPVLCRPDRASQQALALVLLGLVAGQMGQHFVPLYVANLLRSWLVLGALSVLALTCWLKSDSAAGETVSFPARTWQPSFSAEAKNVFYS